jgi:hypothetical protein
MSDFVAFCLLAVVFVLCEAVLVLNGANTSLWQYKTPAELQLQQNIIESKNKCLKF